MSGIESLIKIENQVEMKMSQSIHDIRTSLTDY